MIIYPHLSFDGKAEEAFTFYQSVLGGKFEDGFHYFEEIPGAQIPDDEKRRIMHVNLIVSPSQQIMGSDSMPSAGHQVNIGNNNHISIGADSKEQGQIIFKNLSEGGDIDCPYQKMFWNAYFASFKDKFGVCWMINYLLKEGEE